VHWKVLVAVVLPSAEHLKAPDALYPSLQVGVHDAPAAVVLQPAGTVAPTIFALKSHVLALQVAAVSLPAEQLDVPETVKPVLHVG